MSSTQIHQDPTWARPPPPECDWCIEEIKSGVQLATHKLALPCTTFGRAADAVTIPTAHESCSRCHARIAFDSNGIPWLRDLGSAHGTFVNRRPLPRKAIGKTENGKGEGSRGVIIYPGDMIQFGASTRTFCVVGPPEYDRGAIRLKKAIDTPQGAGGTSVAGQQSVAEKKPVPETRIEVQKKEAGVSWGMDFDENQNHDTEDGSKEDGDYTSLDQSDIPEKHRKEYERIQARRYKLSNLRRESDRIQSKSALGELSAGQSAQLQKNAEREAALESELEALERNLRQKVKGGGQKADLSTSSRRGKKRERDDYEDTGEDDVDDFYDRTVDSRRRNRDREGGNGGIEEETEQSLTAKWGSFHSTLQRRAVDISSAQERIGRLEKKISARNEMDEDTFFLTNDLELAKEALEKLVKERDAIEKEWNRVERMLRMVNDKLIFDREVGFVGDQSAFLALSKVESKSGTSSASQSAPPSTNAMMAPPPRKPSPLSAPMLQSIGKESEGSENLSMPPPPRKPLIPPALSIKQQAAKANEFVASSLPPSSGDMPPPSVRKTRGPMGPPRGTLSAIISHASAPVSTGRGAAGALGGGGKEGGSGSGGKVDAAARQTKQMIDGKKDEWRAPEGQDGSGITRLNAKFGGRY